MCTNAPHFREQMDEDPTEYMVHQCLHYLLLPGLFEYEPMKNRHTVTSIWCTRTTQQPPLARSKLNIYADLNFMSNAGTINAWNGLNAHALSYAHSYTCRASTRNTRRASGAQIKATRIEVPKRARTRRVMWVPLPRNSLQLALLEPR
jgi:hypothetical protein